MDNLFWRDLDEPEARFEVPDDVFDLVFRLRGERLAIDHAHALAQALQSRLGKAVCDRIGVHGVHMADSANGWNRPENTGAEMPLSRRARLVIRLRRDDHDEVGRISDQTLKLGESELHIGESSIRKLSSLGNLHSRAVCCDPEQTEPEFLAQAAADLQQLDIEVARMICGRCGEVRRDTGSVFTRALMVADLKPAESVTLQQRGMGGGRLLGCGLFVPHRGIDPVFTAQE